MSNPQSLIDLATLSCDAVNVALELKSDQGSSFGGKLAVLEQLVPDIFQALKTVGDVPAALAALSEDDEKAVLAVVSAKLNIKDDHAKLVLNKSLGVAASVTELINALRAHAPAPETNA